MADEQQLRDYLRKSTAEIRTLRRRLVARERGTAEPLAIIAMACRFPGTVRSPEDLWRLVLNGTDATSRFPADRGWDPAEMGGRAADSGRGSRVLRGGFLDDAALFDPTCFGTAPREALAMDPQQRQLLEVTWEAVERAGIGVHALRGSDTGVFTGVTHHEYGGSLRDAPEAVGGHLLTGTAQSVASGRIAYQFGLTGPAVTVDTACSSSLVALHLAGQALWSGQCSLALVGAATVMSSPGVFAEFSRQGGLAPDGRCKPFAAGADGTAWAEGVAVLVVERLADAVRHRHPVWALVRGTAVNQDGASNGLTAPHGPAQQAVIRSALTAARLSPADVDLVEAHGTGTPLGDPIEAQALMDVFGHDRDPANPLRLGSVKSNLGHTQHAAGLAGVVKSVMALREATLPPTLYAETPTPMVDWKNSGVRLLTAAEDWTVAPGRPRRVGVSSFGISGTNAHVVLEEPGPEHLAAEPTPGVPLLSGPAVLPLSARSEASLRAQAGRLADLVDTGHGPRPVDVGWSLARHRSALSHRLLVHGRDRAEVLAGLRAVAAGDRPLAAPRAADRPVFVFPGQGSQWTGMARGLLSHSPVFRDAIADVDAALAEFADWSVTATLRGEPGGADISRVDVVQPVLFAVMVSLAAVWRAAGVEPAAVIGHSQGEIAAAHVAGALSLRDAARIVVLRSRALRALAGRGGMASVRSTPERVEQLLARWPDRLSVAAVNAPEAVVVSGDSAALDELLEAEPQARRIAVDYASHCEQVERVHDEILSGLSGIAPVRSAIPLCSTVEAGWIDTGTMDAGYWYRNLRQPVLLAPALRRLADSGHRTFVEMSPHPTLNTAIQQVLDDAFVTGSLRRDHDDTTELVTSLGRLFTAGADVDWTAVIGGGRRVELPTYAFDARRFWLRPAVTRQELTTSGVTVLAHPLLRTSLELHGSGAVVLSGRLSAASAGWLLEHRVAGSPVLPATAFAEIAVLAGDQVGCDRVAEMVLERPLGLDADEPVALRVEVDAPGEEGRRDFAVLARTTSSNPSWIRCASGTLDHAGATGPARRTQWPGPDAVPLEAEGLYDEFAAGGLDYGATFRALGAAWRSGDDVLAEVGLPESARHEAESYTLHPALFDAALHAIALTTRSAAGRRSLPFSWHGLSLFASGAASLRVRITPLEDENHFALVATSPDGLPVATVDRVVLRPPGTEAVTSDELPDPLHEVSWHACTPASGERPEPTTYVVLGGERGAGPGLPPADGTGYPGVPEFTAALDGGAQVPDVILTSCATADEALTVVQALLERESLARTTAVFLTRGAVAAAPGEAPADPAESAVWGLVRVAQNEHPGRFVLLDLGGRPTTADPDLIRKALAAGEPQLAARAGTLFVPRLRAHALDPALRPPRADEPWRLAVPVRGSLDGLALVPAPEHAQPLAAGQVRVAVRAAGLNFRDVLIALDMYPGEGDIGSEGAGVVIEVAEDVTDLRPGDRVFGLFGQGSTGTHATADRRMIARMPTGWTFAQAASVPVAYLTAYQGLVDMGGLQAGDAVLVHAATGGVGAAAVQLARHFGAQVFATAHPGKWPALRAAGVPGTHIASSRDDGFARTWAGQRMDVVLNSLTGELVDASLRLLSDDGTFVEIGKTDVRDADEVTARLPRARYAVLDLMRTGPDRVAEMLAELRSLFESGAIALPLITAWDVRRGVEAMRFMSGARHIGKIVLTVPAPLNPDGTVLVTGGTGTLGAKVVRHLSTAHGMRRFLLAGRRGDAPALREELAAAGVTVTTVSCDVGNRDEVVRLLAAVPAEHPLTAVIHAAGVLDDGVVTSLTPGRLAALMRPKADGARHLHDLTRDSDLAAFVLFSSAAATLGNPGQAGYAAANGYLDALAQQRRAAGLPAVAPAWGLWAERSEMTGHLDDADLARLAASGLRPLPDAVALEQFDRCLQAPDAALVVVPVDRRVTERAGDGSVSPLLKGRSSRPRRRTVSEAGTTDPLHARLAGMDDATAEAELAETVREVAAAVLGHPDHTAFGPHTSFSETGFDSLLSVELRNRLSTVVGLTLPATVVFDHPTPAELGRRLWQDLATRIPGRPASLATALDRLESLVGAGNLRAAEADDAVRRLRTLLARIEPPARSGEAAQTTDLSGLSPEEIFAILDDR